MKRVLAFAAVLGAVLALLATCAPAAEVTLSFEPNNPPGSVEYVIESQAGDAWRDVATGAGSPITLRDVPAGLHTYRARARVPGVQVDGKPLQSEPSNEVTATIPPNAPGSMRVDVVLSLSVRLADP